MKRILDGIIAFFAGIILTPITASIITIKTIFYKNEKVDL